MLTASEARSTAREWLLPKVEPYISVIAGKIAKEVVNGHNHVGYTFSDDELLYKEDIITYLRLSGYEVIISNSRNYVTILW